MGGHTVRFSFDGHLVTNQVVGSSHRGVRSATTDARGAPMGERRRQESIFLEEHSPKTARDCRKKAMKSIWTNIQDGHPG